MKRSEAYVMNQGLNGLHHLFEPCILRMAMTQPVAHESWGDPGVVEEALRILGCLAESDTITEQQGMIASCSLSVQEVIVHLYFHHLYQVLDASEPLPN